MTRTMMISLAIAAASAAVPALAFFPEWPPGGPPDCIPIPWCGPGDIWDWLRDFLVQ